MKTPSNIPVICEAVIHKDLLALKKLIASCPNIQNVSDFYGFRPLELCYLLGFLEGADFLAPKKIERIRVFPQKGSHAVKFTPCEFEKHFHISYLPSLRFQHYQDLEDTLNRFPILLTPLLKKNGKSIYNPFYNQIILQCPSSLQIKWVNPDIGYGVYTTQALPADFPIGEYTGLVRTVSNCQPNLNAYCVHYPTRFFSWNYTIIDASKGGNLLRFVNHSDTPNLKPLWVIDRHLLHLVFVTITPIKPNTQLTINYGEDYWINRTKLKIN